VHPILSDSFDIGLDQGSSSMPSLVSAWMADHVWASTPGYGNLSQ